MKDCNKKIYEKIREYLDSCLTPFVEIVIEYNDGPDRNMHQVVQYNRTASDTWLGVVGNMFDFDFFDCKEVVSFVPFCNLVPTENAIVTIDEDDDDFFDMMFGTNVLDAVRAVCYGDYNYQDDYVRFDAYGNLESANVYEIMNMYNLYKDEIADKIIEKGHKI